MKSHFRRSNRVFGVFIKLKFTKCFLNISNKVILKIFNDPRESIHSKHHIFHVRSCWKYSEFLSSKQWLHRDNSSESLAKLSHSARTYTAKINELKASDEQFNLLNKVENEWDHEKFLFCSNFQHAWSIRFSIRHSNQNHQLLHQGDFQHLLLIYCPSSLFEVHILLVFVVPLTCCHRRWSLQQTCPGFRPEN